MHSTLILATIYAAAATSAEPQQIELAPNVVVRLATKDEAIAALTADDPFYRSLSRFDLQVRMQTGHDVTTEDLKKQAAEAALDWDAESGGKMLDAVARLQPLVRILRVPWPKQILLIRTTGKEDAGAPYTRGTNVILPQKTAEKDQAGLMRMFAHEFFHILSRNDAKFRARTYEIIGFRLCPPIDLPAAIRDRKITNPDAPLVDSVIRLKQGGGEVLAAPVLVSTAAQFDPLVGGTLFRYVDFRLLQVEDAGGGKFRATIHEGKPILLEPKQSPDFMRQIGDNTKYIIHPDEVLADNFVHMILQGETLKNPEIVEKLSLVCQGVR